MEALEIYKSLSQPPKSALREIKGGNLNGKTDINPQWRYEAMTEKFGLVGLGWKYEIQKLWTEPGAQGEALAFAEVAVYIRDPETKEWSDAIVGIGGSKLTQAFSKGLTSNDEGYKMAVTDAFSTSLKMIGVAADIYAGKWDGSKYKDEQEQKPMSREAQRERNNEMNKPKEPGLAGGPDTPQQHNTINGLFSTKYPDGLPVFSKDDVEMFGAMRTKKTANEFIQFLAGEVANRMDKYHAINDPKVIDAEVVTTEDPELKQAEELF